MADPITLLAATLGTSSSISIAGIALTTATGAYTVAGVAFSVIGGYLISTATSALLSGGGPKQSDITADLALPSTSPMYRYVYGKTRAVGTPIAAPVRGEYAYGVWLINSRPSQGNFTLYLDKREILVTGDPYDFSGDGAIGAEFPFENHTNIWFGLGDQTTVPSLILADAPWAAGADDELFKANDIGSGCTVMWMRWKAGKNSQRQERWPSTPPLVEIEGKFSKVYDLRDPTQSLNDKSTWTWTDNHALVVLDALTQNPFRPYPEDNLIFNHFSVAADISDEVVTNKDLSTNPRYITGGTLLFNGSELEDLINPIVVAGAARLTRVAGRLGFVAGAYQESVLTVSDFIGDLKYSTHKSSDELPTQVRVTYTSAERGYESAELEPYNISGAKETDGGLDQVKELNLSWCQKAQQAMRVRKIEALRLRRQVTAEFIAPPEAIKLLGGSTVTTSFPAPYTRLNRDWEVVTTNPFIDILGDSGVSLRNQLSLIEVSEDIFAYNSATEEEAVILPDYVSTRKGVRPPSLLAASIVLESTGGTNVQKIQLDFTPSPSSAANSYNFQFRVSGGSYVDLPDIDAGEVFAPEVRLFGVTNAVDPTKTYDLRIRTTSIVGKSAWVVLSAVSLEFELTSVTATAGVGQVTFTATTPIVNFKGVKVKRQPNGNTDYSTATQIGAITEYAGGTSITHVVTGQPVGTYNYWIVPITTTNTEGSPSGPYNLTIL